MTPPPAADTVAARLLALAAPGEEGAHALWSRAELACRLRPADRPGLDAVLARLQAERQVLALRHGKTVLYAFAEPLRDWLESGAGAKGGPAPALVEAYRRLVRESGGFPDVKISALRAALGAAEAATLSRDLVALWRRGEGTLSLGDWSLASEETRAAAVEINGEKYLLVRLEED